MTYGQFILSESRWHVLNIFFGEDDVSKVFTERDAPDGQPVDVVDGQIVRKLDLDVFTLISPQHVQTASNVANENVVTRDINR